MAVKEICKWDDPALKQKCENVSVKEFKKIKRHLEDTIRSTETGVGMAAPQIGIAKRVIIVRMEGGAPQAFANPTIISSGEELDAYYEGCLSFPDHYVEIARPTSVLVEYMNRKGKRVRLKIHGFPAKVFQHEMDHLDGKCLVGDAWREERTISWAKVQELEEQKKAGKKKPLMGALGAAAAVAAMMPPQGGRACSKSTNLIESLRAQGLTATGRKMSELPYPPEVLQPYSPNDPLLAAVKEADHASFERKIAPRCSRTACKRPGSGYMHVILAKQNPGEYDNYCVRCARKINAVNNEKLVVTPEEFQKVLLRSKGDDSGGDTGKPEEATV